MRQTKFLLTDFVFLIRKVFAGCCQPLLEDGPSRRYLHNLCQGAWTHTPPRSQRSRPFGRLALGSDATIAGLRPHFNLEKFGTRKILCNATSTEGVFRGCSHSLMFRLPYSLDPPVAPTAVTSTGLPGEFTSRNGHVVTRLETLKVLHEL